MPSPIATFITYAKRLDGDEKGEAQVFLDRLFQAFGHAGYKEAGATLEHRVRKGESGRTSFADLVWPGRVLIEMKARGTKLDRHFRQAFTYWVHLVPHRPRWVVLCNFDEFWIYDFEQDVESPMDRVNLLELEKHIRTLAFLKVVEEAPVFGLNRIDVTKEAADKVATVFNNLVGRGIGRERAQRYVLQSVVAKFSEDLDLLPRNFFTVLLKECIDAKDPGSTAFDLVGNLFRQMNNPKPASGGRYREVRYFNGGIFATVDPIELHKSELQLLYDAAVQDWSQVHPAIFGTIFQDSMGKEARHAFGAHFTSEQDILKVVHPTIVRPWEERIEAAGSLKELIALRNELHQFKVFDPACGSGNFLYVAFREMKRLEIDIIRRIKHEYRGAGARAINKAMLSPKQFYGYDVLPFAVELAKVTMLLAKEMGIREAQEALDPGQQDLGFYLSEALPLDNLDENIRQQDSILTDWPSANAIIGNPPYQSKNKMQQEFKRSYINAIRDAMPAVSGMADFCVYFFRKAHDNLQPGGRAGMVGTNTIRQNESRESGLGHITSNGGTITEAVSTQIWSGDAIVHVSIVNWVKGEQAGKKLLSWENENHTWEKVELEHINSSLSASFDVTTAVPLAATTGRMICEQGQTHGHEGFLIPRPEAQTLIGQHPEFKDVLHPFLIGDDMLSTVDGTPSRYAIDLHPRDLFQSQTYKPLVDRIKASVLPDREEAAKVEAARNAEARKEDEKGKVNRHHAAFLAKWWLFSYPRPALMRELRGLPRYIACVRVTKRPIFCMVSPSVHPNDSLTVFLLPDDYSFGILSSSVHWSWFNARCSTFKADPRYTTTSVFDTFAWPQTPTAKQARRVADAAVELRRVRQAIQVDQKIGLRDLYRVAEQPGANPIKAAQAALDEAVYAAYGMGAQAQSQPLRHLLYLNAECAKLERSGKAVVGPGLPPVITDPVPFITKDAISL